MTYNEAMATARQLADEYQHWYEIHTNGVDFSVIEKGDVADEGYEHYMSISPNVRVQNE